MPIPHLRNLIHFCGRPNCVQIICNWNVTKCSDWLNYNNKKKIIGDVKYHFICEMYYLLCAMSRWKFTKILLFLLKFLKTVIFLHTKNQRLNHRVFNRSVHHKMILWPQTISHYRWPNLSDFYSQCTIFFLIFLFCNNSYPIRFE